MTRGEFLRRLEEALKGNISPRAVQENLEYYNQYIRDEMRKGKTEEEVLEMLGDPWAIARTIIDAEAGADGQAHFESGYTEERPRSSEKRGNSSFIHMIGFDTWWKKLLLILGVILFFIAVIAVVTGIIRFLAPFIIPVAVILIVVRMFGRNGRGGPR